MNSGKYIGLDVHQATICVAVMDAKGKVVMESIRKPKPQPFWSSWRDCVELCR